MNPPDHPTPRTDAALLSSDCACNCGHTFKLLVEEKHDQGKCVYTGPDIANGNDGVVVLADFARTLERELAETERLRFGADAERRQLRCDLFDAKWECERLKFALVEWEAKERGWSKAVEKDAAELARLRAELASKTACYDIACGEVQRLRAEVERLKGALALGQQNCDDAYDDLRGERDEAIARAEKAEAEHTSTMADRDEQKWLKECAIKRTGEVMAERDALAKCVADIARQKTYKEISEDVTVEAADTADYQGAYDHMIAEARAAMKGTP